MDYKCAFSKYIKNVNIIVYKSIYIVYCIIIPYDQSYFTFSVNSNISNNLLEFVQKETFSQLPALRIL